MKETIVGSIAAVLVIAIVAGGMVTCHRMDRDLLQECIEKTNKPLECRHSNTKTF